jgi:ABC-type nickel/cobalt efflux system permease component RcnA
MATSLALVGFGLWVAFSAIAEMQHRHSHDHAHHHHKADNPGSRMTLLLILGSSPMIEGIPAFFAAGQYGFWLLVVLALVLGISTIATYVLLCVYSASNVQKLMFGRFEQYGEIASGLIIAAVGVVFWIWPL